MRKMRTLFLVLLCCGLSLYAGVSYVKAEEKVPSDYDAYLQETGMPENEIQKLDEHVKQFIVDDLKNGDGKFIMIMVLDFTVQKTKIWPKNGVSVRIKMVTQIDMRLNVMD